MNLLAPKAPKRLTRPRDEVDEFLSSDIEVSFASSMSLNSPPRCGHDAIPQHLSTHSPIPMDISPAPPVHDKSRYFGFDISNTVNEDRDIAQRLPHQKHQLKPAETASGSAAKSRQRSALPSAWMQSPTPPSDVVPMDVDSPYPVPTASIPKLSFAQDVDTNIQSNRPTRKRHSTEAEQTPGLSSDNEIPSSPSDRRTRKFERFASSGVVFSVQDGKKVRRPALSSILPATQEHEALQSAYPIMTLKGIDSNHVQAQPPVRRAFSAMVPATLGSDLPPELSLSSSDESFVHSSPAAEYAQRNNQRVLRRKDGREEFRPKAGASAIQLRMNHSPTVTSMRRFGAEADGKILPCTSIKEDGLMRVDTATLAALVQGVYDNEVSSYHVLDCRFDYEYNGGHIDGAMNVTSTAAIEDLLLTPNGFLPPPSSSGDGKGGKVVLIFHCEFSLQRAPTIAKHLRAKDRAMNSVNYPQIHYPEVYILAGGYRKFFEDFPELCNPRGYVQMDDPTHAKARSADLDNFRKGKWGRTRSYTYGEINSSRIRPMSLASNPGPLKQPHRNTAPSGTGGVGSLFAAANAARSRRIGPPGGGDDVLATLDEHALDHDADTSGSIPGDDIGDSPCPPPGQKRASAISTKTARLSALGGI